MVQKWTQLAIVKSNSGQIHMTSKRSIEPTHALQVRRGALTPCPKSAGACSLLPAPSTGRRLPSTGRTGRRLPSTGRRLPSTGRRLPSTGRWKQAGQYPPGRKYSPGRQYPPTVHAPHSPPCRPPRGKAWFLLCEFLARAALCLPMVGLTS